MHAQHQKFEEGGALCRVLSTHSQWATTRTRAATWAARCPPGPCVQRASSLPALPSPAPSSSRHAPRASQDYLHAASLMACPLCFSGLNCGAAPSTWQHPQERSAVNMACLLMQGDPVEVLLFILHKPRFLLHCVHVHRGIHHAALVMHSMFPQAMAEVAGLLYNASGDVPCYNVTSLVGPAGPGATWLFQWCAQRAAQELPYFPATGQTDMFWYQGGWPPYLCCAPI